MNVEEEPALYVPAGMLPKVRLIPAAQSEREREKVFMRHLLIALF